MMRRRSQSDAHCNRLIKALEQQYAAYAMRANPRSYLLRFDVRVNAIGDSIDAIRRTVLDDIARQT